MEQYIYNSLRRRKEKFEPLHPPKVSMYVCGPTVYNFVHVGNMRGPVFFNLVRNWLEHFGYEVQFALNYTDIDDRIIDRAAKELPGIENAHLLVSEKYIEEYRKDLTSLGLRKHDHNPKVTEYLKSIQDMIVDLIEQKRAYVQTGDVWYSIDSFANYGQLSGRQVDELVAGARVQVDESKRNPLDFALWKSAKPGEPKWPSPWGEGRPGWHIECSAMVKGIFGDQLDIHGGGMDLIFPHHENEIAQSEGVTHKAFSKYWMHVQMLNFSGQKMSKSIGNFVTMRDFLKDHPAEVYKWMILSVHYRSVCDFGPESVHRAIGQLAKIYSSLALAHSFVAGPKGSNVTPGVDPAFKSHIDQCWKKIETAMCDDFGTPEVVAELFNIIRFFNGQVRRGMKSNVAIEQKCQSFLDIFSRLGKWMSLFQEPPAEFLKNLDDHLLLEKQLDRLDIEKMVQDRWNLKLNKDYTGADQVRDRLLTLGISVMDTPEGPFWEVNKF